MDSAFWIPGFIKRWADKANLEEAEKQIRGYSRGIGRELTNTELHTVSQYLAWTNRNRAAGGATIFYLSLSICGLIVLGPITGILP